MQNVVIYTRVSTDEQATKGHSLPHQKAFLELYCDQKGYNIIKHFKEDFSAKNFNRPEWKKLWLYVKANKRNIDALLITKWDRFSRNIEEAYRVIREFKNIGIEIKSVEQPLDLEIPDSKLLLAVYLSLPEVENDKTSIRVRDASRKAMIDGCFMGIHPIGYLNHRNEQGKSTLKPDPVIAPLIKKVFEEYATGLYSAEELRRTYYKQGLKVSRNSILNILKNPVYIGKIPVKAFKKQEALIVEGLHEGIIDPETFEKVQNLFFKKLQTPVHETKEIDEVLPMRKFIQCPACENRSLTGSGSKGRNGLRHYYYHCNPPCKVRFKSDEVHKVFHSLLKELKIQEDFKTVYKKVLEKTFKQQEGDRDIQLSSLKREINKLEERFDSINDNFFDHLIDVKTYTEMKRRTESLIADKKQAIETIKTTTKDFESILQSRVSFLRDIDKLYLEANATMKKKIIASLFPKPLHFKKTHFSTPEIDEFVGHILTQEKKLRYLKVM